MTEAAMLGAGPAGPAHHVGGDGDSLVGNQKRGWGIMKAKRPAGEAQRPQPASDAAKRR